jgi:leucyl-tRNA synthetase
LKSALYEPLLSRDWYREVTFDQGMHADLVFKFIRTLALTNAPITPHSSEHIWKHILKEESSIQTVLWPDAPVDYQPQPGLNHAAVYMRGTLKSMRDAELAIAKRKAKKGGPTEGVYDPNKPKGLNIFVASSFPPWQDQSAAIAQNAYDVTTGTLDDAKVKGELTKLGLLKDKRVMPFIQMLKVSCFSQPSSCII